MQYLHSRNIIHRDLKPGNIFLDESLYPKIADFGLSKSLSEQQDDKKTKKVIGSGFKGTYAYCSPEILSDQRYTKAGDVYAYGMIVYEIITGDLPFAGFNQYQLYWQVVHKNYSPNFNYSIPYCYKKLIENCWQYEKLRPTFQDIVTILENDTNFITQNVDKEEYLNYISIIKDYQHIEIINNTKKAIDASIKKCNITSINKKVIEYANDFTQFQNFFLDLTKFERKNIIHKEDTFKVYQIQDMKTGMLYAAQISMINIHQIAKEEVEKISKEIDMIKSLNHPSILKFIGFSLFNFKREPKPLIVMELASNGTLNQIIEIERNKQIIPGWDFTKKLINIYGIAAGMSYLHSNDIIHCCLNPSNIYLNDTLFPKIGDFGLSTKFYNSDVMTYQSISGEKATPIYSAPEILRFNEFSKKSDVYAFSIIMYELLTNEIPFEEITNSNQIFNEVVLKKGRPKFNKEINESYKCLIEKCWAQDPNQRPTFKDIAYNLKMNPDFITSEVRKEDYLKYIEIIDSQAKSFVTINNKNEKLLLIDNLISSQNAKELMNFLNDNYDKEQTFLIFDKCFSTSKNLYLNLCKEGILLNNPVAHHKYAISLILGLNGFDSNTYTNARFHLEESIKLGFNLSYFAYARLLYEIHKDFGAAYKYAEEGSSKDEKYSRCLLGFFIAHGIGTKRDFRKGVSVMLDSDAKDFYDACATDFGIYYSSIKGEENKAFYWFEKAYNLKKKQVQQSIIMEFVL